MTNPKNHEKRLRRRAQAAGLGRLLKGFHGLDSLRGRGGGGGNRKGLKFCLVSLGSQERVSRSLHFDSWGILFCQITLKSSTDK